MTTSSFHKIIIGIILLLTPSIGLTQETDENKISRRKHSKMMSSQQIDELHNGALLVRLKTRKNAISALRKTGKNKLADKIEQEQAEENMEIIRAFQENFDFCSTYFFYSHDSKFVRKGMFEKVEFLNDSLLPDSSIKFKNTSFLTAEFSTLDQDTAKYFTGYNYTPGENGLERQPNYVGGSKLGFSVLAIKSDQFIQLRDPFPYYVRTFENMPFERRPKNAVGLMNDRLHKFLEKNE